MRPTPARPIGGNPYESSIPRDRTLGSPAPGFRHILLKRVVEDNSATSQHLSIALEPGPEWEFDSINGSVVSTVPAPHVPAAPLAWGDGCLLRAEAGLEKLYYCYC